MEVEKIKTCIFCQKSIEPDIKFTEYQVIQSCPCCKKELGRAGAFFTTPNTANAKIKVIIK